MTAKVNFVLLQAILVGLLVQSSIAEPPPPTPPPPTPAPQTPAPGTPAPGTPAPGTPAPGTPAPGTPAPGTPAPGTPACTITGVEKPKLSIFFSFDDDVHSKTLALLASLTTQVVGVVPPEALTLQFIAVPFVEKITETELLCSSGNGDCAKEKAMVCHQKLSPDNVTKSATCLLSGISPDVCMKLLALDEAAYKGCIEKDAVGLLIANNDIRLKAKVPVHFPAFIFGDAPTIDYCISQLFLKDFFGSLCSSFSGAKPDKICSVPPPPPPP